MSKRDWLLAAFACLILCCAQAQGLTDAVKLPGSKVVDGFTVTIVKPPTKAVFPRPTAVYPAVEYLIGTIQPHGTDPYAGIPGLEGVSPYLSIQGGGSATFNFPAPATELDILWSTIDPGDSISFYLGGSLQGVLTADDMIAAFKLLSEKSTQNIKIESPTQFDQVIMQLTNICCFEFANLLTK